MLSLLQRATRLNEEPFPYVVIENALPDDLYSELERTRPSPEFIINGRKTVENQRIDLHTETALGKDIPSVWREFINYHTSKDFVDEVSELFGYDALKNAKCGPRTSRKSKDYDLSMECQIGINTPLTKTASVRGPHLDNPKELYGGMFYMRDTEDFSEGGELEIYEFVKEPEYFGKLEIKPDCVKKIDSVPYKKNMFVMFINSPISVHGVSPRTPTDKTRNLVNLIGELRAPLFKTGHGKY